MEKVIKIWKKEGETPLELIDRLRLEKPELQNEKITYAGRLDPLTEGEMILLVGNEVHKKQEYLDKDKEYTVDIILGISTDTFDSLGLVVDEGIVSRDYEKKIDSYIKDNIGLIKQKYPQFSSKTVDGTPLFELTKKGIDFEIPSHEVMVNNCSVVESGLISKEDLQKEINRKNALVKGDFRQDEILERWTDYFDQTDFAEYPIVKINMTVGSGFYVRQFADDMGKYLKSGAFALKITRDKIIDKV